MALGVRGYLSEGHHCRDPQRLRGPMFDELVQWMVQDASRNSRGLKLT
jgi:hypothetical protein